MKSKFYMLLLFVFASYLGNAQSNYYYYYKGEKIYLAVDKEFISINSSVNNNFLNSYESDRMSQTEVIESNTINYAQTNDPVVLQRKSLHNYYLEVKVSDNIKNSLLNYHSYINLLNNDTLIIKASPCYKTLSGKRLGLTNVFYVKIYPNTIAILNSYVQNNNL